VEGWDDLTNNRKFMLPLSKSLERGPGGEVFSPPGGMAFLPNLKKIQ